MDNTIYLTINRFAVHTKYLNNFAKLYADYGIVIYALVILIAWFLARKSNNLRSEAILIFTVVATLISLGIGQIISHIVARQRPYVFHQHAQVLISRSSDFTFPSDHATGVAALATGLYFLNKKLGIAAWLLAVLMAFTRIYVGVHYPSDVLGGLILGACVVTILHKPGIKIMEKLTTRFSRIKTMKYFFVN